MKRHDSNRKRSTFALSLPLILAGALSVLGAGCDEEEVTEVRGAVTQVGAAHPVPIGADIAFESFPDDFSRRQGTETRALITSRRGYVAYFGHEPPAGVQFPNQWVIFYAAGTKPTSGFTAKVVSLRLAGSAGASYLSAVTELESPGVDCGVRQALISPGVLVKFTAPPTPSVEFLHQELIRDCSPPGPCATTLCEAGSHCVEEQVQCVRAPCPPIARCVP